MMAVLDVDDAMLWRRLMKTVRWCRRRFAACLLTDNELSKALYKEIMSHREAYNAASDEEHEPLQTLDHIATSCFWWKRILKETIARPRWATRSSSGCIRSFRRRGSRCAGRRAA
jgi:hypothetical protein